MSADITGAAGWDGAGSTALVGWQAIAGIGGIDSGAAGQQRDNRLASRSTSRGWDRW